MLPGLLSAYRETYRSLTNEVLCVGSESRTCNFLGHILFLTNCANTLLGKKIELVNYNSNNARTHFKPHKVRKQERESSAIYIGSLS